VDIERLRALEKAVELVAKAVPGTWEADGDDADFHTITICGSGRYACSVGIWQTPRHMGTHAEPERVASAAAIVSAVNFIREHGSALIAELGQEVGAVATSELRSLFVGWRRVHGDNQAFNDCADDLEALVARSESGGSQLLPMPHVCSGCHAVFYEDATVTI
jgi:hypothetical protein